MSNEICILTNIDFTILEFMRGRYRGTNDPLASILKRKVDSATVMFHSDVPANVATLNSRVTFSVDGRYVDTRVISSARSVLSVGMYLPLTNVRGLALLGLVEGHGFSFINAEGIEERVVLENVLYQPETSRREKQTEKGVVTSAQFRPALKLIRGSLHDEPRMAHADAGGYEDDPGPSAA